MPALLDRLPLEFSWNAVDKAAGYRFQVALDQKFAQLLADSTSQQLTGTTDLPDGDYLLRVRAFDVDRLEGLNATQAFTVDARPLPPALTGPSDAAPINDAQPGFSWSANPADTAWHFQLAGDADFNEKLADLTVLQAPHFQLDQTLTEGDYFWRVASYQGDDGRGPFSDTQAFSIKLHLQGPEMGAAHVGENEIRFHWQAVAAAAQYHFQLASDADFDNIVTERTLGELQLVIPRPPTGIYYFRARSLDKNAAAGPYGPGQSVNVPATRYWPLL
jgi:hypothetical protein